MKALNKDKVREVLWNALGEMFDEYCNDIRTGSVIEIETYPKGAYFNLYDSRDGFAWGIISLHSLISKYIKDLEPDDKDGKEWQLQLATQLEREAKRLRKAGRRVTRAG